MAGHGSGGAAGGGGFGGLGAMPGIANPAIGQESPVGAIAQALNTDNTQERKLQDMLRKLQIQQAGQALLQSTEAMFATDPGAASDKGQIDRMQQIYSQLGMGKVPMTPGQNASPYIPGQAEQPAGPVTMNKDGIAQLGSPEVPGREEQPAQDARKPSMDLHKMGVTTDLQALLADKNFFADLQGTPPQRPGMPSQRINAVEARLGRKLTPQEAQQVEGLAFSLPGNAKGAEEKSIQDGIIKYTRLSAESNNPGFLTGYVAFQYDKLLGLGYSPENIQQLLGPQMEQAISQMSAAQVTKMMKDKAIASKDQAMATQINTLLATRLQELQDRDAQVIAQTEHTQAETKSTLALLPGKIQKQWADVNKAAADVNKANADTSKARADADLAEDRARLLTGPTEAISLYSKFAPSINTAISTASNNIARLQASQGTIISNMGTLIGPDKAHAQKLIETINSQIEAEKKRQTQYSSQLQNLQNMMRPGWGDQNPFNFGNTSASTDFGAQNSDGGDGSDPSATAPPSAPPAPSPTATPGQGRVVPKAAFDQMVRTQFGGDPNKAMQSLKSHGYVLGN